MIKLGSKELKAYVITFMNAITKAVEEECIYKTTLSFKEFVDKLECKDTQLIDAVADITQAYFSGECSVDPELMIKINSIEVPSKEQESYDNNLDKMIDMSSSEEGDQPSKKMHAGARSSCE